MDAIIEEIEQLQEQVERLTRERDRLAEALREIVEENAYGAVHLQEIAREALAEERESD